MSDTLVEKLVKSFDELENCIEVTRDVLAIKENVPGDVLARIEQYSEIVDKQRALADDLSPLIQAEAWDEVGRRVKLINGLSSMIRDDAYQILAAAGAMPRRADAPEQYAGKESLS